MKNLYHHYDILLSNLITCVRLFDIIGESADIITFGKSTKKQVDSTMIGMYGNGLKS